MEISKQFGATANATKTTFTVTPPTRLADNVLINTYNDHRIAMAFAPLALRCNGLEIENIDVVKKSFPNYWKEMKQLGFELIKR